MKLSIATNWKNDLVDGLSEFPVRGLYGSLPRTPVGGGRPSMILPDISRTEAEKHIKKIVDNGWEFDYLVNAMCLGNKQCKKEFRKEIVEHLKWVTDTGAQYITVANPYLLEFAKYHFPELKVKISVLLDVNSVAKAGFYESLGADEIALGIMMNRDFGFLEQVKKAVRCGLTLLVNQACLYQCPYRLYHGTVNAHASQSGEAEEDFAINYCMLQCSAEKLSKPERIIQSRWIRPEDLHIYESLGFDCFKIAGREMSTEWLTNTTSAYANRYYEGNLAEILNGLAVMMGMAGPSSGRMPYIDNRKLDGFLDYFQKYNCDGNCKPCTYCGTIASKVISSNFKENERFLNTLAMISETIV